MNKTDLKVLLRSRSWRFMKDCSGKEAVSGESAVSWNRKPVYYRPGSSDCELIYKILLKRGDKAEYWVPEAVNPRVILDIGANVGISSIYFASIFPGARIYSCEPIKDNFELLSKNVAGYDNIKAFNVGLGLETRTTGMRPSDNRGNFGGYSLHGLGVTDDANVEVEVKMENARDFIDRAVSDKIDLIKIDTEGSEFDIITAIGNNILSETSWITGELHGIRDFELLAYLSENFFIDTDKTLNKRLFNFNACNRKIIKAIRSADIKRL